MTYIPEIIYTICKYLSLKDTQHFKVNKQLKKIVDGYSDFVENQTKYYVKIFDKNFEVKDVRKYILDHKYDVFTLEPKYDGIVHGKTYCKNFYRMSIQEFYNGQREGYYKAYLGDFNTCDSEVFDDITESILEDILDNKSDPDEYFNYKNDQLHGFCIDYGCDIDGYGFAGGYTYCNYLNGKKHGIEYKFNEDGEFLEEVTWENGNEMSIFSYMDGKVFKMGVY